MKFSLFFLLVIFAALAQTTNGCCTGILNLRYPNEVKDQPIVANGMKNCNMYGCQCVICDDYKCSCDYCGKEKGPQYLDWDLCVFWDRAVKFNAFMKTGLLPAPPSCVECQFVPAVKCYEVCDEFYSEFCTTDECVLQCAQCSGDETEDKKYCNPCTNCGDRCSPMTLMADSAEFAAGNLSSTAGNNQQNERQKAMARFDSIDTDGNGLISLEESEKWLVENNHFYKEETDKDQHNLWFREMDTNGDGNIQPGEMDTLLA